MSMQIIMETLGRLTQLHESLLAISIEKTELLKTGAIQSLQKLLVNEQKHVHAIEQLEKKRQEMVMEWFSEKGQPQRDTTLTNMLTLLENDGQKEDLVITTTKLTEIITNLRQQEQLNEMLLQQSKQFVDLTLDMIQPSLASMNYGNQGKSNNANRSMFDSMA